MPNVSEKTQGNVFYQARLRASTHNDQLKSREGAADIMSIDQGRLYRIESGIAIPYPEEVHLMADLYGAPELRNYFCRNSCPLGESVPEIDTNELDRIAIKTVSIFRKVSKTGNLLLNIVEDGKVSEEEKADMEEVVKTLEELEGISQNLRTWVKKNL